MPEACDLLPEGVDTSLVSDFITESADHLDALETNLSILDSDPHHLDSINCCFRAIHTIKGVSGFLGAEAITELSHSAEDLLDSARTGKLSLTPEHFEVLFDVGKLLRTMIESLGESHPDGRMRCRHHGGQGLLKKLMELKRRVGSGAQISSEIAGSSAQTSSELIETSCRPESPELMEAPSLGENSKTKRSIVKESLRVDTEKIDAMVDTIGELIIVKAMLKNNEALKSTSRKDLDLQRLLENLERISRRLQGSSIELRMIPLAGTFQKMSRLARDTARKLNKPLRVEIKGENTEIDRGVSEKIVDPLVHLIRNAVDHGLESEEARIRTGKSKEGTVTLNAWHAGEFVVVEVSDDGGGINPDRIATKAKEKGLIATVEELSREQRLHLIFLPGFSTAEKVSGISGRGVGMDVVKTNIEALGGRVEVNSTLGVGTTFSIRIPLTIGIIDGQLVRIGDEIYILPLLNVLENVEWRGLRETSLTGQGRAVSLREEILPVIDLAEAFDCRCKKTNKADLGIVVQSDDGRKAVVAVHEILDQQQVVIRNIQFYFRKTTYFSGACILANGSVGLIINPSTLFNRHTHPPHPPASPC